MIRRRLERALRGASGRMPVVTLTGPRQSGKTTLAKAVFPDHAYVSLETPDRRRHALEDPRGFLAAFPGPVIIDEAQRAPELFSYLQEVVDADPAPGRFIVTGSHNFLLLKAVSQSLAGRCAILHLLPFSLGELTGRPDPDPANPGARRPNGSGTRTLEGCLYAGFYPRIHDRALEPAAWLGDYEQTYLERDVRAALNVGDLETFATFLRLCAGRSGQLLNLSSLARDAGVTHTTARRWIGVLEASFIVTLLKPQHRNFGKRLVKAPKLHFLDTGLLCWLLGIRKPAELHAHASRGAIFESFVVAEAMKTAWHAGERPALYHWRDSEGREVDLLIDLGGSLVPVEAKASRTLTAEHLQGLTRWTALAGRQAAGGILVHAGDDTGRRSGMTLCPWHAF